MDYYAYQGKFSFISFLLTGLSRLRLHCAIDAHSTCLNLKHMAYTYTSASKLWHMCLMQLITVSESAAWLVKPSSQTCHKLRMLVHPSCSFVFRYFSQEVHLIRIVYTQITWDGYQCCKNDLAYTLRAHINFVLVSNDLSTFFLQSVLSFSYWLIIRSFYSILVFILVAILFKYSFCLVLSTNS